MDIFGDSSSNALELSSIKRQISTISGQVVSNTDTISSNTNTINSNTVNISTNAVAISNKVDKPGDTITTHTATSSTVNIDPSYNTTICSAASTINLPKLSNDSVELNLVCTYTGEATINAYINEHIYTAVEGAVSSFKCTGPFTMKLLGGKPSGHIGLHTWYIMSETGVYKQSSISWLNTGTNVGESKLYLPSPSPSNPYSNEGVVAHRPMRVTHIRLSIDNEMMFGTDISLVVNARDFSGTDDKRAVTTTVASMTSWTGLGATTPLRTWAVDVHEVIPAGEIIQLSVYTGNYDAGTTTGWSGMGSECYAITDTITYT